MPSAEFDPVAGRRCRRAAAARSPPCPGRRRASWSTRRLEVLRERHSRSSEVVAQAQLRAHLRPARRRKSDSFAKRFIPNPALLQLAADADRQELDAGAICDGLGRPRRRDDRCCSSSRACRSCSRITVGLLVGVGLPHMVIGKLIKRRVAKFTVQFPDAIELMVRGLRSGLPISETIGIVADELPGAGRRRVPLGLRQDEDRPDDGRGAAGHGRRASARPNSSSS